MRKALARTKELGCFKSGTTTVRIPADMAAVAPAFTLRLMAAAGFGLDRPVLQITPQFWQRMHEDEFSALNFTNAEDLLSLSKCNEVCRRFLNAYLNYPLQTLKPFGLADEDLPSNPTAQPEETMHAQADEMAELVPARAQ